jgi:hypothetical protein
MAKQFIRHEDSFPFYNHRIAAALISVVKSILLNMTQYLCNNLAIRIRRYIEQDKQLRIVYLADIAVIGDATYRLEIL